MDEKIPVKEISRKSDGKIVVMKDLIQFCRQNIVYVEDDAIYSYRQSEEHEKPTAWITGKELKLWVEPDEKLKKSMEMLNHHEGEKIWRRAIMESIEPAMTQQRANELKIDQRINLLDETYSITVDGKVVGEPYPMPPGIIEQLMWGTKPKQ